MTETKRLPDESAYQYIWRMGQAKTKDEIDLTWSELVEIMNTQLYDDPKYYVDQSTIRKKYENALAFYEDVFLPKFLADEHSDQHVEQQIRKLREERIKTQTANLERNRIERADVRKSMYYEQIGDYVKALDLPNFQPLYADGTDEEYVLTIADIHYGATFVSANNAYDRETAKTRLELLAGHTIQFIQDHKVQKLYVANLGDTIQGILRMSDLRLNDTSVVKCVVEASHIIAEFLNEISAYAQIRYYHVPTANHAQTRPLGSKAGELADEDLEYIISHYIADLLANNDRVTVCVANDNDQYVGMDLCGFDAIAVHGHQYKNAESAMQKLIYTTGTMIDYLFMGHFHNGKEVPVYEGIFHDAEILLCPSIMGSDPYADKIGKGSKGAAKIFGFSPVYGHNETYKFILS